MSRRVSRFVVFVAATALVIVLSGGIAHQLPPQSGPESRRTFGSLTVTTIAGGLANPWSIAFLPDGAMFVSERAGRLRIIRNGVLDPKPIEGVPQVYAAPFLGLLDVALHPEFEKNG